MVRVLFGTGWNAAWPWAADGDGMSGCGGEAGVGDVAGDELVEGVQCCGELWRRDGSVGRHERPEDVVVDLGVEVREQQPVAGQGVAVASRDAGDEAVA